MAAMVDSGRTCPGCSEPILEAADKRGGRPKVWCSPRCRKSHTGQVPRTDAPSKPVVRHLAPVTRLPSAQTGTSAGPAAARPSVPLQAAPSSGSDLGRLLELRRLLEARVTDSETAARDLPALSRELRNVMKEIGELKAENEETQAERIKREREERRARRRPDPDVQPDPE